MLFCLLALASAMPQRLNGVPMGAANGAIKGAMNASVSLPTLALEPIRTTVITLDATITKVVYRAEFVDCGLKAGEADAGSEAGSPGGGRKVSVAAVAAAVTTDSVEDEHEEDDMAEASVTGTVNATQPTHHGHRSHSINATREFQFNHTTASHLSTLFTATSTSFKVS